MAAATSLLPAITNSVAATAKSGATGASPASAGADTKTIAGNFNTFLTLLTTQLKNQNPLDPLDTNQFTQQLVQFAQVEQQIKQNDQLATMISIERAAQATTALAFVGATVAVDGQTAALTDSRATWSLQVPKPVSATVTIKTSTGQTAYSGSFSMSTGTQNFTWDGRGNNGTQWPAGNYTISITGTDASGQTVAIATEIHGVVDSVDLTKTPPLMAIGGQNFTLDKIKRVVRPGT